MKKGRIIGIIFGYLEDESFIIKVNLCYFFNLYFVFYNCYFVWSFFEDKLFFVKGDFGFGVFVIDSDERIKLLGIVFVFLFYLVVVCKIDEIIDELDLNIVSYFESLCDIFKDIWKLIEKI